MFVRIYSRKTAANARRFLRDLERACPARINHILTPSHGLQANHCRARDNGKEFTDRLFGLRTRAATGAHDFDRLCADLGIEHRLTPPMRPQPLGECAIHLPVSRTNGMVERFNGRIEDVLQSHHFNRREDLEQTLIRYVLLYNTQLPQSVLRARTPVQEMKDWYSRKPELFRKKLYDLKGCDN